ncbi:MAG: dipeptidase [Deinococcota bacterium]|nr:dipeptidase [Deinococcota bacterium]
MSPDPSNQDPSNQDPTDNSVSRDPNPKGALGDYLRAQRARHLDELFAFLRIPSVSADPGHRADARAAADFLADEFGRLGGQVALLETPGHPAVFASFGAAPGAPTVLVYGHYDVQPPEPLDLWRSPPFAPVLEDGLIVARGASDDKGQLFAHVKALEALLATEGRPPVNLKFLIEGEEEIGSPNLAPLIERERERLAADVVLISDGAMMAPDTPTITYGLKGLCYLELRVRGAAHDLHSGAYGGGVPNAVGALCTIIAALKDAGGRVAVPGFYDDVLELSPGERERMAALAFDEAAFREEAGLTATPGEAGTSLLERLWARPTLDVNGIAGGFQGEGAKTVIPAVAMAKLSCRLVPDQDPERVADLLAAHIGGLAPEGVSVEVVKLHGGKPVLTPLDSPALRAVSAANERVFGKPTVFARSGGTIPVVSDFQVLLGAEVILLGLGLESDRAHSPNEKFDLVNYYRGIELGAEVLRALAGGLKQ